MGGTDETVEALVDKAVEMLEGNSDIDNPKLIEVSDEETARSNSRQKRKYELVDMFPSGAKLPNFKKKADQLKKKKLDGAGPSGLKSKSEGKKKKRTKSFLVSILNFESSHSSMMLNLKNEDLKDLNSLEHTVVKINLIFKYTLIKA